MNDEWEKREYNFGCILNTGWTARDIASIVGRTATDSHSSGELYAELELPFGFLHINSTRPVLLNGYLENVTENAEILLAAFRQARIPYDAEAYDDDGQVIWKLEWSPTKPLEWPSDGA